MGFKGWLIVAVVVVLLGEACGILWLWRDKDNAKAALIAAQATIGAKQSQIDDDKAAIAHLTDYKVANDNLLARFLLEVKGIGARYAAKRNDVAELRRTNPDVEQYLSTPIPPALAAILNRGLRSVSQAGTAPAAERP
jgi:hypothetical protein